MRKRALTIAAVLIAALMVWGTAMAVASSEPMAAEEGSSAKAAEEAPILPREEILATLPCFKCHDLPMFLEKYEQGEFSHMVHSSFDVHCSQCHEVKGHMPPQIFPSTCASCHTMEISYKGGGMGKVSFSHEFHTMMFKCRDCHYDTFKMKASSGKLKMDNMYAGKACGKCHNGKVAFEATNCGKCHNG